MGVRGRPSTLLLPLKRLVIMRRSLAVGGALLAVALVVGPASMASAAGPPPPPVAEFPYKPSSLTAGTGNIGSGGPLTEEQKAARQVRYGLVDAARTQGYTPTTAPRPLAPPKAPLRALGGPATYILLAPAVVGGTMQILATGAETQELYEQACGGVGLLPADGFLGWLYSGTGCQAQFIVPNEGLTASWSASTYNGGSILLVTTNVLQSSPTDQYWAERGCYTYVAPTSINWSQIGLGYKNTAGVFQDVFPSLNSGTCNTFTAPAVPGVNRELTIANKNTAWVNYAQSGWEKGLLTFYNKSTGVAINMPTQSSADPLRTPKCRVDWSDGSQTVGTGTPYRESEGIMINADALGCTPATENFVSDPGGPWPDRIRIEEERDGAITTIADQEVPSETAPSTPAESPRPSEGLRLLKVVGTTVQSCMTWEADCANWWADTDEGATPGTYRCTYQGAEIALDECGVYRRTFDTATETPTVTVPGTDEDVAWGVGTDPNSTNPGTGPGTTPGDQCMAQWPSAPDPISWILTPVKCALVWAFVPRTSQVTAAQARIQDGVDNSAVGTVGAALATLGTAFESGVGCGGLPFHLEAFGHVLVHTMLLESCTEPAAGIAATVRLILSVAIIGGGILAFTRYLGSLFGFQSFGRNNSENKQSSGVSFD